MTDQILFIVCHYMPDSRGEYIYAGTDNVELLFRADGDIFLHKIKYPTLSRPCCLPTV